MSRSQPQQSRQREPITDKNWKFPGGKYKNFTVQEVIDGDPGYICWLQHNTDFDFHFSILEEAEGR